MPEPYYEDDLVTMYHGDALRAGPRGCRLMPGDRIANVDDEWICWGCV